MQKCNFRNCIIIVLVILAAAEVEANAVCLKVHSKLTWKPRFRVSADGSAAFLLSDPLPDWLFREQVL